MDREIKFRVYDLLRGKIVSPELCEYYFSNNQLCIGNSNWAEEAFGNYPIMQYTGLKDKNGKEIYEGDIVLFPDEEREFVDVGIGVPLQVAAQPVKEFGQVTFKNGSFGFNCKRKSAYYEKGFSPFTLADLKTQLNELEDIEIIGNIYENPELLTNN